MLFFVRSTRRAKLNHQRDTSRNTNHINIVINGVVQYWRSGWNRIDIAVYTLFLITFLTRVASPWGDLLVEDSKVIVWQQVFDSALAGISFLLWSRLTFMFTISKTLGPLLRMLTRFMEDIINFAFLLFGEVDATSQTISLTCTFFTSNHGWFRFCIHLINWRGESR